jgi:hypothetical protein
MRRRLRRQFGQQGTLASAAECARRPTRAGPYPVGFVVLGVEGPNQQSYRREVQELHPVQISLVLR